MNQLWPLAIMIFLLSMIIVGCHTSKETMVDVTPRPLNEVLEGLKSRHIDYDFFSARAKIKFNGIESKVGGRSRIIMAKDSMIWINFKKLSVEGARALITPDSCKILYRLDDIYEKGATQDFLDHFKIFRPFGEIQELLIGNFPIPEKQSVTSFGSRQFHHIIFQDDMDSYEYLVKEDFNIYRIIIRDTFGRQISGTFTDYNADNFATKKDFDIDVPDEGRSSISLKLSDIELNIPKEVRFEVPDHYTHIP